MVVEHKRGGPPVIDEGSVIKTALGESVLVAAVGTRLADTPENRALIQAITEVATVTGKPVAIAVKPE